jgi:hypothetical protein
MGDRTTPSGVILGRNTPAEMSRPRERKAIRFSRMSRRAWSFSSQLKIQRLVSTAFCALPRSLGPILYPEVNP